MENATKALEMAAGVLIALLIIGLLAYAYNNLSDEKKIEQSSESAMQASEFNKSYEAFNKSGLYGSEILSLANKIVDYNEKEASQKGYNTITLNVTLTGIGQANCFKPGNYNAEDLTTEYNKLSKDIEDAGNETVNYNGKSTTIAKLSKQITSSSQLKNQLTTAEIQLVNEYKDLLNDQTGIARKTFGAPDVQYDKNGRIISMSFVEN